MYLEYYGLNKEPFHITPDPSFLYMSPSHKEALGAIIYGVEKRKGFIAIIGEVGVGKTSILRAYLERKASQKQKTIYIFNPVLSFHELLISMFRSLDLTPRHDNVPEMVNQLHEALIAEYQAGGTVVVAIDEAQNMPVETLENLRMFSNLETSTDKLIQIILLGQPELGVLLQQAVLRQLKQRIVLWATISPLTREESQSYITHRIARACSTGSTLLYAKNENSPALFSKSALNLIAREAKGIPRRINILCDNALITGFGRQVKPVPVSVVKEIMGDLDTSKVGEPSSKMKWVVGFGVAIILILGLVYFFDSSWRNLNVEIQSRVNQLAGNPTGDGFRQQVQDQKSEVVSEKSPNNGIAQEEKPSEFLRDPSQKNAEAQASVDVPDIALIKPDLKENRSSSTPSISTSENDGIETGAIQERDSSKHSTKALDNSISPSGSGQTISTDMVRDEPLVSGEKGRISDIGEDSIRAVREGDSLSRITMETYGSQKEEYLDWVKRNNPQIVNPDLILPGQNVVLPKYPKNKESQ